MTKRNDIVCNEKRNIFYAESKCWMGKRRETRQWHRCETKRCVPLYLCLKTSRKIFTWAAVLISYLAILGCYCCSRFSCSCRYSAVVYQLARCSKIPMEMSFFETNSHSQRRDHSSNRKTCDFEKAFLFWTRHNVCLCVYVLVCTFSMAVYIAIESHRLYFHLANSKQLNYTWK